MAQDKRPLGSRFYRPSRNLRTFLSLSDSSAATMPQLTLPTSFSLAKQPRELRAWAERDQDLHLAHRHLIRFGKRSRTLSLPPFRTEDTAAASELQLLRDPHHHHPFASAAKTSAFASAVSTTFDSSQASDERRPKQLESDRAGMMLDRVQRLSLVRVQFPGPSAVCC